MSKNSLQPPVILVTGANRGIGRELCRQLQERGCTVIAASRRPQEQPIGEPLLLDVLSEDSLQDAAREAARRWPVIDALVNNAAILEDQGRPLLELSPQTLRFTLDTNLLAPLRVAQVFWDRLADGGSIVNVSSVSGQLSAMDAWAPGYSISKTALNGLTVQLAIAGTSRRIRVNSVCPGWVRTEMGGPNAVRSVEQGAAGITWLLLDAPAELSGRFVHDRRIIPW